MFVCTVTIASNEEKQDKANLKSWVNPHKLKRVNDVWYKQGRCVITGSLANKHIIIKSCHNPPVYGHPGISKTTQLVEHNYWWPHMTLDIVDYIKGCAECQ